MPPDPETVVKRFPGTFPPGATRGRFGRAEQPHGEGGTQGAGDARGDDKGDGNREIAARMP